MSIGNTSSCSSSLRVQLAAAYGPSTESVNTVLTAPGPEIALSCTAFKGLTAAHLALACILRRVNGEQAATARRLHKYTECLAEFTQLEYTGSLAEFTNVEFDCFCFLLKPVLVRSRSLSFAAGSGIYFLTVSLLTGGISHHWRSQLK